MRFDSILINVTEQCHVGCRHCGYIGSRRDREMSVAELESWVEQAAAYGVGKIIFTGGEAFERYELLAAGVRRARQAGASSAVFTSSAWAASAEAARSRLEGLRGLGQLYLSTDIYHQERVPVENVCHAIDAGLESGVQRITLVITYATEADRAAIAAQYGRYGSRVEITSQLLIPNKISRKTLIGHVTSFDFTPRQYSAQCWLGTPLVNPDGAVFACHVGKAAAHGDIRKLPYFLGDLREASFAEIMGRARKRADYQYLRTHGPRGVAEMVQMSPPVETSLKRSRFTSGCDMCMCVMLSPETPAALSKYAEERTEEIDVRLALLLEERPVFGSRSTEP